MNNKRIWAWVIISILSAAIFYLALSYSSTRDIVGNDRNEYGCIDSAGYSWCEAKNKCLRQWEEECEDEVSGTVCTQKANLCPDGSYVGRTGPNCEFADCPSIDGILPYVSGVNGIVILGPTCPVERIPPDPGCADKPYKTMINVFRLNNQANVFLSTSSDADGRFSVSLPPGEYILKAGNNNSMLPPSCSPLQVAIEPNSYTSVTISCDTGIR